MDIKKRTNTFLQLPKWLQLLIVVLLFLPAYFGCKHWLNLPFTSPMKYAVLPFIVPIYSFVMIPIMSFFKIANYKSEALFTSADFQGNLQLHFGSFFDSLSFIFSIKKGFGFKRKMMTSLLEGLLVLIQDIEDGKIPKDQTITASSYFFKLSTAEKLGFKQFETQTSHKVVLFLNYLEIFLMYSMVQGKLAFPNLKDFKSVKVLAGDLVENKEFIEKLYIKIQG